MYCSSIITTRLFPQLCSFTTYCNMYVIHTCTYIHTYMKVVGNNRLIWLHLQFLKYLTGGSGMISRLFSCRPIVKILICRFTISSFMIIYQRKFPGNFVKTSGKSLQLDWKTISATMIKSAWVSYNKICVMSHIVVLRRTSRSHLDWTPTIFSSDKKVSFFSMIFHIHAAKKHFGVHPELKIWSNKFTYF